MMTNKIINMMTNTMANMMIKSGTGYSFCRGIVAERKVSCVPRLLMAVVDGEVETVQAVSVPLGYIGAPLDEQGSH